MEEKCPSCDEKTLLYSEEGFFVCTNCGYTEERRFAYERVQDKQKTPD